MNDIIHQYFNLTSRMAPYRLLFEASLFINLSLPRASGSDTSSQLLEHHVFMLTAMIPSMMNMDSLSDTLSKPSTKGFLSMNYLGLDALP